MDTSRPHPLILFLLFSMANVLGTLMTAAMPDIQGYFQVSKAASQDIFTLYLLGCMLGQIPYAPIANAFGRKTAIYTGGGIAILGVVLCLIGIYFHLFSWLLVGRFVTALGASSGAFLTNTILSDSFTHAQIKKILSYLVSGFAIVPSIGVSIGGFLTEYIAWQSCFYFMLLYAILVIGLCVALPETAKETSKAHLNPMKIALSYIAEFKNLYFVLVAGIVACGSITLYIFAAEAPFVAKNMLDMSAGRFGLYNFLPNIGLLVGGFFAVFLGKKLSSSRMVLLGSSLFCAVSLIMWLCFKQGNISSLTLFGLPMIVFFALPFIFSSGQVMALSRATNTTYGSSVIYILQYSVMLIALISIHFFSPQTVTTLPLIYSSAGALMLLFYAAVSSRF